MVYPSFEEFKRLYERFDRVPVYRELDVDFFTPISFVQAFSSESLFLLESANLRKSFSRYSFFGFPDKIFALKNEDPFSLLASLNTSSPVYKGFGSFVGGLVGLIGYGASNFTGILREKVSQGEDLGLFMLVNRFFVADNYRQRIYAVFSAEKTGSPSEDYRHALDVLSQMESMILDAGLRVGGANGVKCRDLQVEEEFTQEEFCEAVSCLKTAIENGEAIQVVLSEKIRVLSDDLDPVSFYRALRRINPSPYLFYLKFDDAVYCGSSPEIHLKVIGRKAFMKPIAGTYPVGPDLPEIIKKLKSDEKERAEHLMLVDLARNDLYTYCSAESVKVPKFMEAEVYSHVVHLVSSVVGKLKEGIHPAELLRKTFPAGTVTGAPKVRAQELIEEFERSPRDFYAGCVGYVSYSGDLDTCITIRSARFRKGELVLRAGAGIVYDSVPKREYREVRNKLAALFEAFKKSHRLEESHAPFGG